MPQNPFTDYNSNQRVVAIPISPSQHQLGLVTAVAVVNLGTITLSAANAASGVVPAYVHYLHANIQNTAALASALINFQFQFQTAAHAAVGAATIMHVAHPTSSGTGILSNMPPFEPPAPAAFVLSIPATAVELAFQAGCTFIAGAPAVRITAGWGIDVLNAGTTGEIGGSGMVAQSSTNPNTL